MKQNDLAYKRPKVYVIACGVLAVDIRQLIDELGIDATTRFLPGGLHNEPEKLQRCLQQSIDEASQKGDADRLVIGYGVCGLGTVGIQARTIPLAMPRVHDCIALFLGGDAAYKREFARYPGTYYYSVGWSKKFSRKPLATTGSGWATRWWLPVILKNNMEWIMRKR